MKLATIDNATRDGRLVVVSKDLSRCLDASSVVATMQAALDDWDTFAPGLQKLYEKLNSTTCEESMLYEQVTFHRLALTNGSRLCIY